MDTGCGVYGIILVVRVNHLVHSYHTLSCFEIQVSLVLTIFFVSVVLQQGVQLVFLKDREPWPAFIDKKIGVYNGTDCQSCAGEPKESPSSGMLVGAKIQNSNYSRGITYQSSILIKTYTVCSLLRKRPSHTILIQTLFPTRCARDRVIQYRVYMQAAHCSLVFHG